MSNIDKQTQREAAMGITHIVSFSGGRTSGRLVREMENKRKLGWDVRYVFMDTGAEHPETYKFIREVVANWVLTSFASESW
ncbi:phosphoadenosine phosphosulfate reductase domain-containing protein [Citrobacter koseri]|uniref:phosphoadenosine phosphosulfate reductase domain-containing protein n=1 Tax=Citrobacter koseri TaxID=545 RepID=UPI000DF1063A|nr:phosphoadenosine phosphosulfate reductase family protein [Citrobacter koseri]STB29510.1 PUA domain (predicted RNA-binding domain) [Citrobacter koseri]